MTPDNLIIEDFDFCQYPITRIYPLGGKTVIQIGEPSTESSRKALEDKLFDLQCDYDSMEKERDELSNELESIGDSSSVKADREELQRLEDAFDQIEQSISDFATDADIRPTTNEADNIDMLHEKYTELKKELDEADETIGGMRIDNNALAYTIFRQEQTIAKLEELLAAKEK